MSEAGVVKFLVYASFAGAGVIVVCVVALFVVGTVGAIRDSWKGRK